MLRLKKINTLAASFYTCHKKVMATLSTSLSCSKKLLSISKAVSEPNIRLKPLLCNNVICVSKNFTSWENHKSTFLQLCKMMFRKQISSRKLLYKEMEFVEVENLTGNLAEAFFILENVVTRGSVKALCDCCHWAEEKEEKESKEILSRGCLLHLVYWYS